MSQSETVAVETELTYVSNPKILRDLGSFKVTETNQFAADYCTTYSAGEKFDTIYIAVEPPEAGVTLSYAYYVNTEQDFETAEILEVKSDKLTAGYDPRVGSYETYGVKPVSGFAEGEYYIWCAVTASAEDGRTAQSISGPVKLTFESLPLDFAKGGAPRAILTSLKRKRTLRKFVTTFTTGNGARASISKWEMISSCLPIGLPLAEKTNLLR